MRHFLCFLYVAYGAGEHPLVTAHELSTTSQRNSLVGSEQRRSPTTKSNMFNKKIRAMDRRLPAKSVMTVKPGIPS